MEYNGDTMEGSNMVIKIEGMMCPHCEAHCKAELEKLDFVITATPSHEKGEAVLELDESKYDEAIAENKAQYEAEKAKAKQMAQELKDSILTDKKSRGIFGEINSLSFIHLQIFSPSL